MFFAIIDCEVGLVCLVGVPISREHYAFPIGILQILALVIRPLLSHNHLVNCIHHLTVQVPNFHIIYIRF